jgi:hypothetical protein
MMPAAGIERGWEVEISLISLEAHPGLGVQVVLPLDGPATGFMVPGISYGENRVEGCRVRYPRVSLDDRGGGDALTSNRWAFRADRASHPVVLGWTRSACVALAVDEVSSIGLSGLAFSGGADAHLLVNFPAREEPVTFLGEDAPGPPEVWTHHWQAGEIVTLTFRVLQATPDPHAYDAVLRAVYQRDRSRHRLNTWLSQEEAAALTAHGLYQWHFRGDPPKLAGTVAFHQPSDRIAREPGDLDHGRVAPVSGAVPAHALLTYARRTGVGDYADAAVAVLDTIANSDWSGDPGRTHTSPVGESTLFMIRALRFEEAEGIDHPTWRSAIESNLNWAVRLRCPGLLWIPALLEGARYIGSDRIVEEANAHHGIDARIAAELAGTKYGRSVEEEFTTGAAVGSDLAPSSEDGYHAVMAFVALYEATGEARWLTLACRAADWMLSFRWSYNLRFPEHTTLKTYDYRSRGADLASPRNQHLQGGGLICLPEMVRLAKYSHDRYYLERTRDNLACFLQFIAREDGDFNARKGMVTGHYYNSRGFGPKGAILPISHARSAGLVLYACQAGLSLDE